MCFKGNTEAVRVRIRTDFIRYTVYILVIIVQYYYVLQYVKYHTVMNYR